MTQRRTPFEDFLSRHPVLPGSPSATSSDCKDFLSAAELKASCTRDTANTESIHVAAGSIASVNTAENSQITHEMWLDFAHGRKEVRISYYVEGVNFQGGTEKLSRENRQFEFAWAECWIGDEESTSEKLDLKMFFAPHPNGYEKFLLTGQSGDVSLERSGKEEPVGSRASDRQNYLAAIHRSLSTDPDEDQDKTSLDWVTVEILRRYKVLIGMMMPAHV